MTQVRDVLGRARPLAVAVLFTAAAIIPALSLHQAGAAALTERSLLVTSSVPGDDSGSTGAAGAATNGTQVGHTYTFTAGSTTAINGFRFLVCDNAFGYITTCTNPTGFAITATPVIGGVTIERSTDGVTFSNVTLTGWAISRSADNQYIITNASGTAITPVADEVFRITIGATAATSFQNPDASYMTQDVLPSGTPDGVPDTYGTYFVHISTHTVNTGLANANLIDEGTVTNAIATAIDINTRVQETLKFSVEGDMRDGYANENDGVDGGSQPNAGPTAGDGAFNGPTIPGGTCLPLTGLGTILMGDSANNALASNTLYDAQSYFRIATNSAHGARVFYSGNTLSSGSETIDAIAAASAGSAVGTEQFGLTLNSGQSGHVFGHLTAATSYNSASAFRFVAQNDATNNADGAPVELAASTGIVECDTGAVRYIANIADETAAGIYTTRIVYIAAPSY